MKILVNGESSIFETDDDVTMEELFEYLRQELPKSQLVVRTFVVDGKELNEDEDNEEVLKKSPAGFETLDVTADPPIIVARDVLSEWIENIPLLSNDAIKVTETLQSGDAGAGTNMLMAFIDEGINVVNSLYDISRMVKYQTPTDAESKGTIKVLDELSNHLKELGRSLNEKDMATVGDILEFDIAPAITNLIPMMKELRESVVQLIEESQATKG